MKIRILIAIGAALLFASVGKAQTADYQNVVGVWRAQAGNLPVFTMVVSDEGGGLSGAILFYLLRRESPNQPETATPGNPQPMLHPTFDGTTLSFQVSHRRAHPPQTQNDPPITLTFKAADLGKPQTLKWNERTLTLTRTEY